MFHVFKNTQFCLLCIVVLSVLEFNLCSSFLSVKMGLMNDGIVPSKKSRAHFQSQKLNNKIQFPFWYVSLFIQCLKVENMLSSQVTLLILGFCTGPKKWSHTFMSLLTTTKNPKRDKFIDIIFFRWNFQKILLDSTHFNCKYTLNQNQNILKILIFQF